MMKRWMGALLMLALLALCVPGMAAVITVNAYEYPVEADGWYDSMEEVAVYLEAYDQLPENYLTKKEAQNLGWVSSKGNLWKVADGCSIGGDRFGNYEGLLPDQKNRRWTECDIDYSGGRRNSKRIVFSNDGLIYYTDDHYASFDEIEVVWEETDVYEAYGDYGNGYDSYDGYDSDESGYEEAYGTADFVVDLFRLFLEP